MFVVATAVRLFVCLSLFWVFILFFSCFLLQRGQKRHPREDGDSNEKARVA